MASSGKFAHGSTFSIGGTAVGDLTNISLPDRTRDSIELTDHDSDGDREFTGGLRDGGSVTLEGRLAMGTSGDTGQTAIETNYNADGGDEVAAMVITLPDNGGATATTYTFNGFVTAINGELPMDDAGSYSVTVKVAGAVTKALATAA